MYSVSIPNQIVKLENNFTNTSISSLHTTKISLFLPARFYAKKRGRNLIKSCWNVGMLAFPHLSEHHMRVSHQLKTTQWPFISVPDRMRAICRFSEDFRRRQPSQFRRKRRYVPGRKFIKPHKLSQPIIRKVETFLHKTLPRSGKNVVFQRRKISRHREMGMIFLRNYDILGRVAMAHCSGECSGETKKRYETAMASRSWESPRIHAQ